MSILVNRPIQSHPFNHNRSIGDRCHICGNPTEDHAESVYNTPAVEEAINKYLKTKENHETK